MTSETDEYRTWANGWLGVFPNLSSAIEACRTAVADLCDRCQAVPGTLSVTCAYGCEHWQCRECCERTSMETADRMARGDA